VDDFSQDAKLEFTAKRRDMYEAMRRPDYIWRYVTFEFDPDAKYSDR
jgi:hypothetical protein